MGKLAGTVVRGTPVNHVGPAGAFIGGREGYSPGTPKGMNGTVKEQFDSDRRGYQNFGDRGGTPYTSQLGNPDESRRVAEGTGRYGIVTGAGGIDHNDPAANGRGVIFDKADDARKGFQPPAAPTMDSPVPRDAPWLDTRTIREEDRAHLGVGNEGAAETDLRKIDGVSSR